MARKATFRKRKETVGDDSKHERLRQIETVEIPEAKARRELFRKNAGDFDEGKDEWKSVHAGTVREYIRDLKTSAKGVLEKILHIQMPKTQQVEMNAENCRIAVIETQKLIRELTAEAGRLRKEIDGDQRDEVLLNIREWFFEGPRLFFALVNWFDKGKALISRAYALDMDWQKLLVVRDSKHYTDDKCLIQALAWMRPAKFNKISVFQFLQAVSQWPPSIVPKNPYRPSDNPHLLRESKHLSLKAGFDQRGIGLRGDIANQQSPSHANLRP